ncbi:MAG TPA: RraA family protein [Clostridia bacterium]|nr:RraA family protein [Clostridia bacterium]
MPVISDTLDKLGARHQAMHQRLRPMDPNNCTFAGRARTLQWLYTEEVRDEDPYGVEIDAMDSLRPGDVVVHSTDARLSNAPWGELMTTAALKRGAVACVCDSMVRDCRSIQRMNFPVFHVGVRPVDSNGRAVVKAFDVPITCGGVKVCQGDLIVADFDGIVVVPDHLEEAVLPLAAERIARERAARRDLEAGLSLREVFRKYQVL